MKKQVFLLFILVFSALPDISAQPDTLSEVNPAILGVLVINGDTLYYASIEEVSISAQRRFSSRRDYRRYQRLIHNVKVAYPYAQKAAGILEEMNHEFLKLETDRERRRYVKKVEERLMDEFGDDLKSLTITQGQILIKLIDRETGDTSYELLRELRGSFSAFFWQSIARLFGSNLKSEYDPLYEDRLIEDIIFLIEIGEL